MNGARGEVRGGRLSLKTAKRRVLALLDTHIRQRLAPVSSETSQAMPPPVDGRGFAHEGDA
jgi:hypothetical protein